MTIDIATVYADELKKVGITLNVKPVQFQKLVDSLTKSYDWQSIMISVGSNYFPIQGDNVWLSSGNLHLWNPLHPKPATAWEAKIDQVPGPRGTSIRPTMIRLRDAENAEKNEKLESGFCSLRSLRLCGEIECVYVD